MPEYPVYANQPTAPSYSAPLVDFSPISKLADSYYQGQQQGRTLKLENLFNGGLPTVKDSSGKDVVDPTTGKPQLDISAMTDALARAGGADAAMPLINRQIDQQIGQGNANASAKAQALANGPGGDSQPAPQQVPAHGIPDPVASPSVTPTGMPTAGSTVRPPNSSGPVAAPTGQQGDASNSLISILGQNGVPPEQAGYVSGKIAQHLNIADPNAPITDPNTLRAVGNMIIAAKSSSAAQSSSGQQAQPQANPVSVSPNGMPQSAPQTSAPTLAPPAATAPTPAESPAPNLNAATASRYEQAAASLFQQAARVGKVDPQGAAALQKQAEGLQANAQAIRNSLLKNQETTPEIKNSDASGAKNPIDYELQKDQNKDDVTRYGKQLSAIQGSAGAANRMLGHIQLAEGIYNNPNFYSGTGEGVNLMYKKVVNALNPNNTEALPQEAFRKTMAAAVLNQVEQLKDDTAAVGGGGRIFQSQIELMEKAANNPDNSIPANRLLTEIAKRSALQSKQIATMANSYKGGHLDSNFAQKVDDYYTKNPMFTPAEMSDIRLIAPPVAPKLESQEQAVQWSRKAGVKPGDPIKLPSGRIVPAP